jgi:hypothetical protein
MYASCSYETLGKHAIAFGADLRCKSVVPYDRSHNFFE